MVKYSNFPTDQKIYGTNVLEYFGIWPAFRSIHKMQLKNSFSAKSVVLRLVLAKMDRSDFTNSVNVAHVAWASCCLGWCLSGLQGTRGSPGCLSDTVLQTGRAAQPCSWLGLCGAEGFGCLAQNAPLFAFFPGCFWLPRLLSACGCWLLVGGVEKP